MNDGSFEVFTAVTIKNAIFWDVTLCGSCENQHFGGMCCLHQQDERNQWAGNNVSSNLQLKHTLQRDGDEMFFQNISSHKCHTASQAEDGIFPE
jgi:hypothetical protein